MQARMHACAAPTFLPGETDNNGMVAAGKNIYFLPSDHSRYRKAKAGFEQDLAISGQEKSKY